MGDIELTREIARSCPALQEPSLSQHTVSSLKQRPSLQKNLGSEGTPEQDSQVFHAAIRPF